MNYFLYIVSIILVIFILYKYLPSPFPFPYKFNKHVHNWKLISKTYLTGNAPAKFNTASIQVFQIWIESLKDKTSYLFQCSDVKCNQLRVEVLEGKEISNENAT